MRERRSCARRIRVSFPSQALIDTYEVLIGIVDEPLEKALRRTGRSSSCWLSRLFSSKITVCVGLGLRETLDGLPGQTWPFNSARRLALRIINTISPTIDCFSPSPRAHHFLYQISISSAITLWSVFNGA